ncbi:hypothetical protein C8A03DRAFT_41176 [Achaetomium macrosporum]|uniref:C2H2-type domain-containing protein n=1 Tax=Achaetomium macrosporum TaxID=79813 RepID=A0AAN7HGU4_9PEZI|nr:hypothetical protein C8A03DRAFT_41176 [Achaetomium macrosporum]
MALGTLPSNADAWGRWPHHQQANTACGMVEASNMVPYDCRSGTTAPIPRPELGQQFLPGSFPPAPMHSPTSPQYQVPVSYGAFTPYTPTQALNAPFRTHESLEHPQPRGLPALPAAVGGIQERNDSLYAERSASPSIKSEARSTMSESASPSSKAIVPNVRVQGAPVYQFHSPIDRLVRVIDAKRDILDTSQHEEMELAEEGIEPEGTDTQEGREKPKRKRFRCDIPGCNKMFAQKNNLDTHRRAHTGESPYVCPICLHRFTQTVNLKSHIRRHFGDRPYKCPQCPKAFSQPSNVKAHVKTHERRELRAHWVCRFGGCKKSFTAKGNLKSHQNTYHREAIEAFNAKLAAIEDKSMISEEDKEMARYIADVHNLANKGIKGRGKGRKVKRILPHPLQQVPPATHSMITTSAARATHFPMPLMSHGLPHAHAPPPQQPAAPLGQHFYDLSNPAAYSMSRPSSYPYGVTRDAHGHESYGILDSDQMSEASSLHSPSPVMHVYEDEHDRELAFGDRLY